MSQGSHLQLRQWIKKADLKSQEVPQQDVSTLMFMLVQGLITSASVDVVLMDNVLTALSVNPLKLPAEDHPLSQAVGELATVLNLLYLAGQFWLL